MRIISFCAAPEAQTPPASLKVAESNEVMGNASSVGEVSWATIFALLTGEAATALPSPSEASWPSGFELAGTNLKRAEAATATKPVPAKTERKPVPDESKPATEQPETGREQGAIGQASLPAGFMLASLLAYSRPVPEQPALDSENDRESKQLETYSPVTRAANREAAGDTGRDGAAGPAAKHELVGMGTDQEAAAELDPWVTSVQQVQAYQWAPDDKVILKPAPIALGQEGTSLLATSPAEPLGSIRPRRAPPQFAPTPAVPLNPYVTSVEEGMLDAPPDRAGLPPARVSALWPTVAAPVSGPTCRETPEPTVIDILSVEDLVLQRKGDRRGEKASSQQLLPIKSPFPAGGYRTEGAVTPGQSSLQVTDPAVAPLPGSRREAVVANAGQEVSTATSAAATILVTRVPEKPTTARGLGGWMRYELEAEPSSAARVDAKQAAVDEVPDRQVVTVGCEPVAYREEITVDRVLGAQTAGASPAEPPVTGRVTPATATEFPLSQPGDRLVTTTHSERIVESSTAPSQLPEDASDRTGDLVEQKQAATYRQPPRKADVVVDLPPKATKAADMNGPDRQNSEFGEKMLSGGYWEKSAPATGTPGEPSSPYRAAGTTGTGFASRLLNEVERLQQWREEGRVGSPVHRISLLLEPPDLGMVEATIDLRYGEVRVRMTTHTAAGEAVLTGQLDSLRAAMTERGLSVGELRVIPAGLANREVSLPQGVAAFIAGQGFQDNPRGRWFARSDDELPPLRPTASVRQRTGVAMAGRTGGTTTGRLDVTA